MGDRVMPPNHTGHDLELVAAVAAGGANAADARRGGELIRTCSACEAIAADLRSLSVATRALGSVFDSPQSAAPRDFRLTSATAERLRKRRGLGFLADGPARPWARGLGSGLVAVGFAALVLSAASLNFGVGGSAAASGPKAEQQLDTRATFAAPVPAGGTTPNLSIQATDAPARYTDANASPTGLEGSGSATLALVGGAGVLVGIGLLLATRSGRRAGP